MSDHLCFRDSLTSSMALLAATRKIKVAPAPMSPYSREPIISAMSIATMDEFAPGRVIAGPGTGNAAALKEAGIDSPHPLKMMREYVDVLRRLLSGEMVNFKGEMIHINGAKMGFAPKRPIPMYITAVRSRMLQLGGEIGDGVLIVALIGIGPATQIQRLRRLLGDVCPARMHMNAGTAVISISHAKSSLTPLEESTRRLRTWEYRLL